MRKMIWIIIALLSVATVCNAGDGLRVFGYSKSEGVYSWSDVDPTFGICSYTDINSNGMGIYGQLPIVKYKYARINLGYVRCLEHVVRSRGLFSVSYILSDSIDFIPEWIGMELGVYVGISPYEAYGAQLGLLRIKW